MLTFSWHDDDESWDQCVCWINLTILPDSTLPDSTFSSSNDDRWQASWFGLQNHWGVASEITVSTKPIVEVDVNTAVTFMFVLNESGLNLRLGFRPKMAHYSLRNELLLAKAQRGLVFEGPIDHYVGSRMPFGTHSWYHDRAGINKGWG
jgi:hypothetical protein